MTIYGIQCHAQYHNNARIEVDDKHISSHRNADHNKLRFLQPRNGSALFFTHRECLADCVAISVCGLKHERDASIAIKDLVEKSFVEPAKLVICYCIELLDCLNNDNLFMDYDGLWKRDPIEITLGEDAYT